MEICQIPKCNKVVCNSKVWDKVWETVVSVWDKVAWDRVLIGEVQERDRGNIDLMFYLYYDIFDQLLRAFLFNLI